MPIVWFFSLTTGSETFMALFHIIVVLFSYLLGARIFGMVFSYIEYKASPEFVPADKFLLFWQLLFFVVCFQMAFFLKPLMVEGAFFTGERGLFLSYLPVLISGK
jgi:hypothetical protein